MIEIVLDQNEGNVFLDKERPVFEIKESIKNSFRAYREKARELLNKYGEEKIIIVRHNLPSFSNNLFSVALFVESCLLPNQAECAVIKVKDYQQALQKYKPFIALTIGIKYVMRLCSESVPTIYREISGLGYLGLEIKNDFVNNKIYMTLPGTEEVKKFRAENVSEALVLTGMLKSLALARTGASIEVEIDIAEQDAVKNQDMIINQIVTEVKPWIYDR